MNLAMAAGAARPEGPAVMPEGVFRQPVLYTKRPAAITALAASPWAPLVAIAGQRQIVLYNTDSAELAGVLPFPRAFPTRFASAAPASFCWPAVARRHPVG